MAIIIDLDAETNENLRTKAEFIRSNKIFHPITFNLSEMVN